MKKIIQDDKLQSFAFCPQSFLLAPCAARDACADEMPDYCSGSLLDGFASDFQSDSSHFLKSRRPLNRSSCSVHTLVRTGQNPCLMLIVNHQCLVHPWNKNSSSVIQSSHQDISRAPKESKQLHLRTNIVYEKTSPINGTFSGWILVTTRLLELFNVDR